MNALCLDLYIYIFSISVRLILIPFVGVFPRVSDNWLVAPHTMLCNDSSLLNVVLALVLAHTYLASVRDLVP